MKSLFEQSGGVYTMQGDYRLPNLTLPAEDERPIGVWGQRRLRYLKQHHTQSIVKCVPLINRKDNHRVLSMLIECVLRWKKQIVSLGEIECEA